MERELKIIEVYELGGQRRYRVRVVGTNLVVNVTGSDEEEALANARKLLERLKIEFKT